VVDIGMKTTDGTKNNMAIIHKVYQKIIENYALNIPSLDTIAREDQEIRYANDQLVFNLKLNNDTCLFLPDAIYLPELPMVAKGLLEPTNIRSHRNNPKTKRFSAYYGNFVDNWWFEDLLKQNNFLVMTPMDTKYPQIINMPLGFMSYSLINQSRDYHKILIEDNGYQKRIIWRGNDTHEIRHKSIPFFSKHKSGRFDVKFLENFYPYNIDKPPNPVYYRDYCTHLMFADICLAIRGDLPWLFSFFDILRMGTIPCFINCYFYKNMGWENIGINPDDIMLSFDTSETSLEEIAHSILELHNNKERVLYMKHCIFKFMKNYIMNDFLLKMQNSVHKYSGWGDFIIAKYLEMKENNFSKQNTQFISSKVHDIKYALRH
jgi:hypothetical protein